ncbi:UDP-phosphate N-acetylglucosaminyl 1-phosphate transferase [Epibacterium mobile]|nr:UDP-phosphate N-acetylglucosaminyl 1-phosphate transferase [Tritonibacter mobilis]
MSVIFAPVSVSGAYADFIFATSLLFLVGLSEDLGFHVSPRWRLMAAAGASLLAIWLLGVWMPRTGIPGLDAVVDHWLVGIPLTLLVTAGISNGFNLIDGVNGLASVTAIVGSVALSQIAALAGYTTMVHLAMMLAAGIFGFFLLNYPFGLIFLGDAGAYTLGFVLSWFGIAVLINAPEASPWAILLVLFWPVADTMLAIYRRSRRNADVSAPDRLHVHQMVMRALEICILGRNRRQIANPLTTLVLSPFVIAPPIAGVLLWNQNQNAFLAVVVFGVLFFTSYAAAPGLIRRFRR